MPSLVVDTHTLIWHITADPRLSRLARETLIETARYGDLIYIPPICLVEWIYLVEKGRVPREGLDTLTSALADPRSALKLAAFDLQIIDAIYRIPREIVPDLPDRVIAGTAFALQLPLVSRDARIQVSDIKTIW